MCLLRVEMLPRVQQPFVAIVKIELVILMTSAIRFGKNIETNIRNRKAFICDIDCLYPSSVRFYGCCAIDAIEDNNRKNFQ